MSNGILIFTYFIVGAAGFVCGAMTVVGVWGFLYFRKLKKSMENLKVKIVD